VGFSDRKDRAQITVPKKGVDGKVVPLHEVTYRRRYDGLLRVATAARATASVVVTCSTPLPKN
jgi:hypothetical protein